MKQPIDKAALAERLVQLSEYLDEVAGDMRELGYPGHADQLGSMGCHAAIYGYQIQSKIRIDAELRGAA